MKTMKMMMIGFGVLGLAMQANAAHPKKKPAASDSATQAKTAAPLNAEEQVAAQMKVARDSINIALRKLLETEHGGSVQHVDFNEKMKAFQKKADDALGKYEAYMRDKYMPRVADLVSTYEGIYHSDSYSDTQKKELLDGFRTHEWAVAIRRMNTAERYPMLALVYSAVIDLPMSLTVKEHGACHVGGGNYDSSIMTKIVTVKYASGTTKKFTFCTKENITDIQDIDSVGKGSLGAYYREALSDAIGGGCVSLSCGILSANLVRFWITQIAETLDGPMAIQVADGNALSWEESYIARDLKNHIVEGTISKMVDAVIPQDAPYGVDQAEMERVLAERQKDLEALEAQRKALVDQARKNRSQVLANLVDNSLSKVEKDYSRSAIRNAYVSDYLSGTITEHVRSYLRETAYNTPNTYDAPSSTWIGLVSSCPDASEETLLRKMLDNKFDAHKGRRYRISNLPNVIVDEFMETCRKLLNGESLES